MQIPLHKIDEHKLFIKWRDITIAPNSIEQAHRHNYYQLMFLEKVNGHHEIDFESYDASSRSLHFVGKGRVHKVNFDVTVQGGVLLFPEAIFGSSENDLKLLASFTYFKSGSFPTLHLSKPAFAKISILIDQIKESLHSQDFELSKFLLFALLIQIRGDYNKSVGTDSIRKESEEVVRFGQLLKQHSCDWNSVEDYTTALGITTSRLNNLCKEQYGKTALRLIHDRKLLDAKRMLVYTEKQVKEIAYDCGFDDVAYFNRFFKKHTNCTPLAFRNNH